ncbi:hypothetical protein OMP38_03215 [Cohnella ginsengisoli]|uniref:Uncharacterized protein n=1 Tax=Cohnella ginsengisoli TaxID=425004 RepID=A0A9X4KDF2_9BACL|nr:hypothetical protein [Cohnella ginsengisoli]MDG0789973.1 hypothetical protein [Cohnella ginsengisoli]
MMSFFYVGNLKEPMVRPKHMFGYSPVERTGTGEEIDKFNLLLEFENELEILQSYTKMFAFLDSINLIPVVIRNNGTRRDEEIKVKIYLPKSVRIVKVSEFMIPDDRIIKDFTGFKGFIHYKFTHSSDGHINSYLHQPYDLYPLPFFGIRRWRKTKSRIISALLR